MQTAYLTCATPAAAARCCATPQATGAAGRPEEYFEARRDRPPRRPREHSPGLGVPRRSPAGQRRPAAQPPPYSYSGVGAGRSIERRAPGARRQRRVRREGDVRTSSNSPLRAAASPAGSAGLFAPQYVWVRRADTLRQAISLWRAMQTQTWREGLRPARRQPRVPLLPRGDTSRPAGRARRAWARSSTAGPGSSRPTRRHRGRPAGRGRATLAHLGIERRRYADLPAPHAPPGRRSAESLGRRYARDPDAASPQMTNILYLHSHDTGRYVQPYGHAVPTPNIQRLADQGVLFRQAFSAAPTCSGSRAALLTGQYAALERDDRPRAPRLRAQRLPPAHRPHAARRPATTRSCSASSTSPRTPRCSATTASSRSHATHVAEVAPLAVDSARGRSPEPFFLSVGFFETHRDYFEPARPRRALLAPAGEPSRHARDPRATWRRSRRARGRSTRASARCSPRSTRTGSAERTLVIRTTDHGLPFPGAKATLYDRGIGVLLICAAPAASAAAGRRCARLAARPLPHAVRARRHRAPPSLQGTSLLPLVRGEVDELHDELFAELTYHAAYEPQRSIRTAAASTSGASTPRRTGAAEHRRRPDEGRAARARLAERPARASSSTTWSSTPTRRATSSATRRTRTSPASCAGGCERGWRETDDPLLDGPVPLPRARGPTRPGRSAGGASRPWSFARSSHAEARVSACTALASHCLVFRSENMAVPRFRPIPPAAATIAVPARSAPGLAGRLRSSGPAPGRHARLAPARRLVPRRRRARLGRFRALPGPSEVLAEWLSPEPAYGISVFTPLLRAHPGQRRRVGVAFLLALALGIPLGLAWAGPAVPRVHVPGLRAGAADPDPGVGAARDPDVPEQRVAGHLPHLPGRVLRHDAQHAARRAVHRPNLVRAARCLGARPVTSCARSSSPARCLTSSPACRSPWAWPGSRSSPAR